ncbi:MAG: hypothetical protein M3O70_03770 [Actinomycetota bacterium]|nr:hypothetical protein [Actinomycetota bacterium]
MAGLYLAIRRITGPFSIPYEPRVPQDTVLALIPSLPESFAALVSHALRLAAPLLTPAGILALLTWLLTREGGGSARTVPPACWASLLLAGAIVVQPLAINPDFPGSASNEQRTSALGLLPLVIAVAFLLERLERWHRLPLTPATAISVFALLGLGSLHHVFTTVGPDNRTHFIASRSARRSSSGPSSSTSCRRRAHPGRPASRPGLNLRRDEARSRGSSRDGEVISRPTGAGRGDGARGREA